MNQEDDKINELLLDNRFVDWVINPQSPYSEYWLQWINADATNANLAEEAKNFLLELRKAENDNTRDVNEGITEQMLLNIREAITEQSTPVIATRFSPRKWYWIAAAACTGILIFLGISFFKQDRPVALAEPTSDVQSSHEVIRYNGSQKNELVFLPDGSKVTLAKGARVSYDRLMNGKERKVLLNGEAFFDVVKNPEKPFYIHTKNMVIKVLGTSFRVTASAGKESVIVKTGKVSVYLKGQDLEQSAAKILMPEQVCTYSVPTNELITSDYTGKSKIEIETDGINVYSFEDESLDTVLKTLEKIYSLPVHYNKEMFKNCFVTISLENESLEENLKVITKTVGASFSISDYGISIEGKGCK
ncbi:MAG TPA: FecR family protein [Chitinophagaceae bacterium]|nr:FecR family protein [Chitinophagaceae bacterium]